MRQKIDSPWKDILRVFFKEIADFFVPDLSEKIDWSKHYECLDKELLQIQKGTEIGDRIADTLIKVFMKSGKEAWILIHAEVQKSRQSNFSQRMWQYYYRIYDRYQKDIFSMAILVDSHKKWRPDCYKRTLGETQLLFKYKLIKLIDFEKEKGALKRSSNPIAKVVETHLEAIATENSPELRLSNKVSLVKSLYHLGQTPDQVRMLFKLIDHIMNLPSNLDGLFLDELHQYEGEIKMQYITSVERLGIEKGRQEGFKEGIEKGIEKGIEEEKLAIAKNLKQKGMDFPFISEVTGLSIEEIERL